MATYIEINNNKYPASITGRLSDKDWDNRASKAIKLEMSYDNAVNLFTNDVAWNIIQEQEIQKEVVAEDGAITYETEIETETYDNSDYCLVGDITIHQNNMITVKMGKPTAEELLAMLEEVL